MLTRSYRLRAFPALQQLILNRINDIVTLGVGLTESGVAIGQALGTILPTLGTAIGQVLDGEFVPAFNTVTDALRDAAVGIATPTLTAIIDRRTRALEVSAALQTAVPLEARHRLRPASRSSSSETVFCPLSTASSWPLSLVVRACWMRSCHRISARLSTPLSMERRA